MLRLIASRLLMTVPVVAVVALLVNLALYVAPGDPAATIAGDYATPETIARIREQLGLGQGFFTQFFRWISHAVRGDLGNSIFFDAPVTTLVAERLTPTLSLAALTLAIAIPVAIGLGILAAWKQGGVLDRFLLGFSVTGFSVPVFVLGYVLVYFLSVKLSLLPVQGFVFPQEDFGRFLAHLILPACAMAITIIAFVSRMTRAAMIDVLAQDYIRTARAKGLSERAVVLRHGLKNGAMPIVTTVAASVATLISGAVVTETVFSIPGVGRLVVDAILQRDYPVIQGATLLFSLIYIVINLVVDILYVIFDPRIKL